MYTHAVLDFNASVVSASTRLSNSPNPGVSIKLTVHSDGAQARKETGVFRVHFGISLSH